MAVEFKLGKEYELLSLSLRIYRRAFKCVSPEISLFEPKTLVLDKRSVPRKLVARRSHL